jgi:hypothetical protein
MTISKQLTAHRADDVDFSMLQYRLDFAWHPSGRDANFYEEPNGGGSIEPAIKLIIAEIHNAGMKRHELPRPPRPVSKLR